MSQLKININKVFCEMCGENHVEWTCPSCKEDQIDYGTFYEGGFTQCDDCDLKFDVVKIKGIFRYKATLKQTTEE